MFDNLFTVENLLNVLGTFAYLFGELFLALHRHKLLRGPVASVGVEGPHQAHPLSSPQGHQRRARRGARGGDAVLLMLHHPRAGGALQERRSVLGSHIVFDDIAHPQPGHHRAFARVLRARSHAGLHRHHLHVRGVRGASARRSPGSPATSRTSSSRAGAVEATRSPGRT